jgi:FkbM family methyltransferase
VKANPRVWLGEGLRWYLTEARHPLKNYIVGHYWPWFCKPGVWISYDDTAVINVCLGDYMQQRIFFDGYYERAVIEWLRRTLRPTDVLWDVGANIGAIALVAARLCRRVIAFEPDPRSIERLTRNVRINRARNVVVVPAALGDRTGTAILHQSPPLNTGMSSMIEGRLHTANAIEIRSLSADAFLATRPESTPDIMKIDVEGAEHLVLRGAADLLRTRHVRAIVFEDRHDEQFAPSNQALIECLRDSGYTIGPLGASDHTANDGMYNFVATLDNGRN